MQERINQTARDRGTPQPGQAFLKRWRPLSVAVMAAIAMGGLISPTLGLGVLGLMAAAVIMNVGKRRSFCAGACPNGNALSLGLRGLSRMKRLPAGLASPGTRRALCGLMLFCMIGLAGRAGADPAALGRVFWSLYLVSMAAGLVMGLVFKPRAWCAVCPMGTLQDTLNPPRAEARTSR